MKNNDKMICAPIDAASAPEADFEAEENGDVVQLLQALPNEIFTPEKSKVSLPRGSQQEEDPDEYLTAIRLPSEMARVDVEMKSLNLAVEQDMKQSLSYRDWAGHNYEGSIDKGTHDIVPQTDRVNHNSMFLNLSTF